MRKLIMLAVTAASLNACGAGAPSPQQDVTIACDILAGLDQIACPVAGQLVGHVRNGQLISVGRVQAPASPPPSSGTP